MSLVLNWHNNKNKSKEIFKPFVRSGVNFQSVEEIRVEEGSSTPVERNKFFSICCTPGVEQFYSKILLRNGVAELE